MLIVGFAGYAGRGINPAAEVAKALDGQRIGGRAIVGAVLPVDYAGLQRRLEELVERHAPRAVICLGLWPGEPVIRLERIGVNVNDFEVPDNEGRIASGPIDPSGPAARLTSLPIEDIQHRLLDAGIPARLSSSAGNFLCNATLYTVLGIAEARSIRGGFIHLPYLPAQVAEIVASLRKEQVLELHQRADLASMSFETSLAAIRIAVEASLENSG
jgi:pyroglutamyl-peptidase